MPQLTRPGKIDIMSALADPAPTNRWGIGMTGLPDIVQPYWDNGDINRFVTTTGVPRRTAGDPIAMQIRGHEFERPGVYNDEHTIELEFIENTANAVSLFLKSWRDYMFSTRTAGREGQLGGRRLGAYTGIQGSDPGNPAQECVVDIWRMDNQDLPIWFYEMHGCYYRDYDPVGGQLTSDEDSLKPTFTLYYDWFLDGPVENGAKRYLDQ